MMVKFIVYSASAVGAVAIVASLVMTIAIFNDINNLYEETMQDMKEFKDLEGVAWQRVMGAKSDVLFERIKRNGYNTGGHGGGGGGYGIF